VLLFFFSILTTPVADFSSQRLILYVRVNRIHSFRYSFISKPLSDLHCSIIRCMYEARSENKDTRTLMSIWNFFFFSKADTTAV